MSSPPLIPAGGTPPGRAATARGSGETDSESPRQSSRGDGPETPPQPQIALNASVSQVGSELPESVANIVLESEADLALFMAKYNMEGERQAITDRFATFLKAAVDQIDRQRLEASLLVRDESPSAETWDRTPLAHRDPSIVALARDCGRQCAVGVVKRLACSKLQHTMSATLAPGGGDRESPSIVAAAAASISDPAERSITEHSPSLLRRFDGEPRSTSPGARLPTPPASRRSNPSSCRPSQLPAPLLAPESEATHPLSEHSHLSDSNTSPSGQPLEVGDMSNFSLAQTTDDPPQLSATQFPGPSPVGDSNGRKWLGRAMSQALSMYASSVVAQMDLATRLERMQNRLRAAEAHIARVESNRAIATSFSSGLNLMGGTASNMQLEPGAGRRATLAPSPTGSPQGLGRSDSPETPDVNASGPFDALGRPVTLNLQQVHSPSKGRNSSLVAGLSPRASDSLSPAHSMRILARALARGGNDLALTASVVSAAYGPVAKTTRAEVTNDESDGSTMINQYLVLSDLGQGSQGKVVLAVDTESGETRAIKEIPRPKPVGFRQLQAHAVRERALRREIAVMKKCRHKNVVALYEVIDDPDAHAMFLVMQYVEHGPLATQKSDGTVAPIAPARLASFARQLCAGLHYLHSHGVVHRDIKPENILLGQNDQVFLADFGISSLNDDEDNVPATLITEPTAAVISNDDAKSVSSESTDPGHGLHGASNQLGTLVYRSPELVQGAGSPAATDASDVWALGLSLYVLLYGRLPFPLRSAYQFLQHITDSDVEFPPTVPPSADAAPRTEPDTSAAMPDIPDQGNGLTPESSQAQSPDKNDSGDSPQLEYHSEWRELLSAMLDKNPSRRIRSDEAHRRAKALHVKYMELEMLRSIREADLSSAIVTRRRPPSPMSLPASGTNSNPHQQHRQHSAQTSDRASSPLSSRHASEVASSI